MINLSKIRKLLILGLVIALLGLVTYVISAYVLSNLKSTSLVPNFPAKSVETCPENYYLVTRVIDGDTVDVRIDNNVEKVRMLGIDTPETVKPKTPVQCFGNEASNKTKELLDNRCVKLEADSSQENKDVYGRLLRYVYLDDSITINELLIKQGYAKEYTFKKKYKLQTNFKEAETYAKTDKLGLWRACN